MQSAHIRQGEVIEKCARKALICFKYFQFDVIFGKTSICRTGHFKSFCEPHAARGLRIRVSCATVLSILIF